MVRKTITKKPKRPPKKKPIEIYPQNWLAEERQRKEKLKKEMMKNK